MHCEGLTSIKARELQQVHGFNEIEGNAEPEWRKVVKRYFDPIILVIFLAAIISVVVPNDGSRGWTSFVLLIVELNIIVWVGYYSDRNAGNAVKELKELSAPTALVKRDGEWKQVEVRELVPGDLIDLKGGDVVPADAVLVGEGEPLKVDESSLTGESLPVSKTQGAKMLSGSVIVQGESAAVVSATGGASFFGKTVALLSEPEEIGHLRKVLSRVTLAIGALALAGVICIMATLLGRGDAAGYSVVIAFVILASTVPVGMPVVTGTVLAIGAREMARHKAIVNRLASLEELSGMEVLASDKTGTLTLNRLTLDKEDVEPWEEATKEQVLLYAALSAKWENNDAIDRAVTGAVGSRESLKGYVIERVVPFNPVDKKTTATFTAPDGRRLLASKGAPQIIGAMLQDPAARAAVDRYMAERASRGLRALGVATSADGGSSWQLVGLISLLDPPREDTKRTIELARQLGIEVKMVTGDQLLIAVETSRRLGLGTNIMEGAELMQGKITDADLANKVTEVDGFAGVYPEHKHKIVTALQSKGRLVGMTGDGVNDAPALKKANVGIAVAGATSAAKGAADIILTEEGLGPIITAIQASRTIFARLQSYLIYRIASSLLILGFFFFGIIILGFEMPTWAIIVINITNDASVMATSFDKVHSSDMPLTWNMTKCLVVAACTAAVGIVGSVILLFLSLPNPVNWFSLMGTPVDDGLPGAPPRTTNGQVVACIFLALMIMIQLNIFATRNPGLFWRFSKRTAPRPSLLLIAAVSCVLLPATFIAVYWPENIQPDGGRGILIGAGWAKVGIVWAYSVAVWLIADVAKTCVQAFFIRQERVKEDCKMHNRPLPLWVRIVDWPGNAVESALDHLAQVSHPALAVCVSTPGFLYSGSTRHQNTRITSVVLEPTKGSCKGYQSS
ncbi:P-type ATPase [Coccomyxa subellipsoidea C-169]|uniref:Plasma membrane ATPase n=1 Tax=Coccomyxa subellipsoidea (strain C-169) TaxID=574566 RepID=I0YUQ1_COCSC|nr:P-type ATPase [Coccomyxa subellipsoidea C-169]EIE22120.1 P-type ATPase [Coccomyxa subellipsoidea C-169]|eukprot:XP_005646664.1 P-type ATPase [Coccomyxa subellipsoidea C-169]